MLVTIIGKKVKGDNKLGVKLIPGRGAIKNHELWQQK